MKRRAFSIAALFFGCLLVFNLVGCGDGNAYDNGNAYGNEINTVYRGAYNGSLRGNDGEADKSVLVSSNSLRYVDNSFSITQVSTSGGNTISGTTTSSFWAYLYKGTVKIGIVIGSAVEVPGWTGKAVRYYLGRTRCSALRGEIKGTFNTDIVTDDMSSDYSGFGVYAREN